MIKFDISSVPPLHTFITVFYKSLDEDESPLCNEIGFWDGESFYRINWISRNTFHPQKIKFPKGWTAINV